MKLLYYILFIFAFLASCSEDSNLSQKKSKKNSHEYNVIGVILDKIPDRNELTIHHEEIPGFMMAMTMNFKLSKNINTSDFNIGDSVHFKLFIKGNDVYSDNFNIIDNVDISHYKENEDDFWMDDEYSPLRVGEAFNDATFLDFNSNEVKLSDFEDDFMFVTFIFTRCPIPNMCPALIYKQRDIATKFSNNNNLKVLTISFDHTYDTPGILEKKYRILKSSNDNWLFLSSYQHLNDLYMFSKQSAFSFWGIEKNDIGHNMRTILIGPGLKFLKYYDGNEWNTKDVESDILNMMKVHSNN